MQIGQLANAFYTRPQGTLPAPLKRTRGINVTPFHTNVLRLSREEKVDPITKTNKSPSSIQTYMPPLPFLKWLTVALSAGCSTLLQQELPQKLKGPCRFTFSFTIGDVFIDNALCDLDSINLMPSAIFNKIWVGELKSTCIILQLAARTVSTCMTSSKTSSLRSEYSHFRPTSSSSTLIKTATTPYFW